MRIVAYRLYPASTSSTYPPPPLPTLPENFSELYRPIVLKVPATPRHAIRPDPDAHGFFTVGEVEELLIYRRRQANP